MTTTATFPEQQTVSFTGQENLTGEQRKLFETKFGGEVFTLFKSENIMMSRHRVMKISKGDSYSFPMIGKAGGYYHTPGRQIKADPIAHAKRKATIDALMVSPVFIDNLQDALTEYEYRKPYADECGYFLTDCADKNILRMACKASFITNEDECKAAGIIPVKGETFTDNITLNAKGDELKGDKIYNALVDAKNELAKKKVRGRPYVILASDQYHALLKAHNGNVAGMVHMNKDVGGEGSVSSGTVPRIAGFDILMSNNLPQQDESAGLIDTPEFEGRPEAYRGDYSKVVGIVMLPDAVCTVKAFDLAIESKYQMEYQGNLVIAKYAMGHNILRPACAITILKKSA
ncbi:major capsid protein [Spartinivicinus ruber]|uniref:hypothetical protein n=1 Tax=Spartinivicinus ruber TaxID=2683272 RepID=UPI0013D11C77|nr:hypothetical protein [Spartinivicinus ruber]